MKYIALFLGIVALTGGYIWYQSDQTVLVGADLRTFISTQLAGSPVNGYVLSTDGSVNSWIPAAGGGSSKWTDGGSFIFPSTGEYVSATYFTGTSTTATSTFNNLGASNLSALTSAGLLVYSNNHTQIADLGAGSSANSIFFGGVNINGATRLATSLSGMLQATAGAVTATTTGNLTETVTGLQFDNTRALIGGDAILSLTSGYDIPLSASTTQWSGFYNTPSSRITAGNYLSWSTNTLNASVQISTSSSNGALAFWTGSSALGNVATGTLTETVTGLELNATRGLVGGAAILAITSGYGIPLTASTTEWTNFYNTPSGRVTAGTGLSWSNNTLNNPAYWSLMSGGLRTATSTDFARAAYFVATSTTGTSTFAHNVNIGTSTVISRLAVQGLSSGSILQLLSNTGTKFMEILNTGVTTLLGAWDWGGATSIEIVNGSAPTVDATGEIAVDTTSDQYIYYGSATKRVLTPFDEKSAFIASTTIDKAGVSFSVGTSTFELANYSRAVTLDTFYCKTNTGTTTVRFGDGTNWTAVVVCGPGGGTGSSLSNNTFTAREDVQLQVGSAVGTPAKVTVSASFLTTAD